MIHPEGIGTLDELHCILVVEDHPDILRFMQLPFFYVSPTFRYSRIWPSRCARSSAF